LPGQEPTQGEALDLCSTQVGSRLTCKH